MGPRELTQKSIENCLLLMHHRGPDHSAFRRFTNSTGNKVYLLHSRLSIIDLEARSNQPFEIEKHWLTFNGELYNYRELRAQLEKQGLTFQTSSDTEVLLKALISRGLLALDEFEGMWAFAFYDEDSGSLMLSRDRFGEKPLYIYRAPSNGGVYFGSEIKFIHSLLGQRLEVNIEHLCRYLINGYKALYKKPQYFFRGLEEVPSGNCITFDADGRETLICYWRPQLKQQEGMARADAVAGVRERLFRSVELRLRADVPLAFCMSGGVDSNTLISIAKRVWGYDVHGFTVVNSDARYKENEMVAVAVRELGIKHTSLPLETAEFLPRLRKLVISHDGPLCTISYYIHWLLMGRIAENGYKISISGTGADELFSGYYDHHLAYLREIACDPQLYQGSLSAWKKKILPLVRNPHLRNPDLFLREPAFRAHIFLDAAIFSSYLFNGWYEPFVEEWYVDDLLRNRMLNELFHEVVPPILHEDDLNAMFYSIENRSPFLDRSLMEFAFSIPTRELIKDGLAKSILREAMSGLVPQKILANHRKVGFNAPIFSLLDVQNPQCRAEILADSPIYEIVKREKIEALLNQENLANSQSKFLFYFLNSKIFLEEFG